MALCAGADESGLSVHDISEGETHLIPLNGHLGSRRILH